ncbi:hypothetical protein ACJIZ3_024169 [Penstemon smallii]|uniref:DUF4378 domain-containing protein n=1 Tax=Penstemon smallii TaxID=265156 RepID=A0ABD3TTK2_9LAMI
MERGRHRKSKSDSGVEGFQWNQKQKASRLSSDSRSYNEGNARNDMACFMPDLGQRSSGRVTGTPMKKLLAEEMSKEVESKRRPPSVIAKLMGLEGLPSPRHVNRQEKRYSDSYQQKNVSVNTQWSQLHDGLLERRSSAKQQEFKDVYEDLEASHVVNRRCSSRWSASSLLTKREMALIQQKFIDAKRLSTDEKLHDSKVLDDALEMLDSNKDLLLKFLQQPDSLFVNHLHDEQDGPTSSIGSQIAILKPLNSVKYEGNSKAWNSERDSSNKHDITSHLKRKDGLLLETHNRRRSHISRKAPQILLEEKNDETILPTRIVVLKPNLKKMQNAGVAGSSSNHSHYLPNFKKMKEYPSSEGSETVSWRRKDSSRNVGFSKPISKEAREIARQISRQMRDGFDENVDARSTCFRGYAGDESSYDANESDSDSASEVIQMSSRNPLGSNKLRRYSSSSVAESSVSREAKQRLSERWRMTQKYQDLEMFGEGSTLGDMLALPDRETRTKQLNTNMSSGGTSNRLGSNSKKGIRDGPLGISSRDGWKVETKTTCRSRSLPPSIDGRSHRRSSYHDELAEEKHQMCSNPTRRGRSKVLKGNPSRKEDFSSEDSKARSKKPLPYHHMFTNGVDSLSEASFEIQLEASVKELSEQQAMFQMAAKDDTCKTPAFDVKMIAEHGCTTLASESSEFLPKESSSVAYDDKSAAQDQEGSGRQELHNGPPEQDSPSLKCLGSEPDCSESCKEPDHPSPVSVLEVPYTEETSSSECFERVSTDLHELRMQLQLLKMESNPNAAEVSTLVPTDEELTQLSPILYGGHYILGAEGWETSYALDVLIGSGLDESSFDMFRTTWYSPDCPLDPKLFNNLEKKYNEVSTGLRSERMLIFDRLNLALIEIFQEHVDLFPWVMPNLAGLSCIKQKEGISVALEKLIDQDYGNEEILERVLDREMQWSDYKGEIDVIGNEIEKLLIDEMILEVVCI